MLAESSELLELAETEDDASTVEEVEADIAAIEDVVEKLEFRRMFSRDADVSNAFLDIQAGSGGTEAQGLG